MRINELLLYRMDGEKTVLPDMAFLMEEYQSSFYNKEDLKGLLYQCVGHLLEVAGTHGFEGNLWHVYLTFLLVENENTYSTQCEVVGEAAGSINEAALHDFGIFKELFDYEFDGMEEWLDADCFRLIRNYAGTKGAGGIFNENIRARICGLARALGQASDVREFQRLLTQFYKEVGVGKFGLHKAFRVERSGENQGNPVQIVPITKTADIRLADLVGYELPKQKLVENTRAFVEGRRANNCLLFGDAGTGKSSSVKAVLNEYYDRGLRMIEVYKHQFQDLNAVIAQIKNRNYKFIIFMDDLSFEEFEIEYKYLKAVIEGGLERKPDNVLIYATSNRRHLVREKFSDKEERADDLHKNDTVQEKLSLVARFGVTIYFESPARKEFHRIVAALAEKHGIPMREEELLAEADKWELGHGGLSGRTAQQFIDYLLGRSDGLSR